MNDKLETTTRVRPSVTIEVLKQLNVLNEAQLQSLAKFGPLKNIEELCRHCHR
jgi:hypothetical protein